jgi:hypothetical protein
MVWTKRNKEKKMGVRERNEEEQVTKEWGRNEEEHDYS